MKLREATMEDARLLWKWRNDPEVRAASYSTDEIPFEEHVAWLDRKLADPTCRIFIGETDRPVGVIRFDTAKEGIEVSVSVAEQGKGLGTELIRLGCQAMGQGLFIANVKPENIASQRAFMKAGFIPTRLERRLTH